MTLAVKSCSAGASKLMYAASTEPVIYNVIAFWTHDIILIKKDLLDVPEIVAKPPVMTECSSDGVILPKKGLIMSGASV